MNIYKNQSKLIKKARKLERLTLEEFGKKVGVHRQSVYAFESGRQAIPIKYHKVICHNFDISSNKIKKAYFDDLKLMYNHQFDS
jgi:DNA-binding XRE family transcriptional regulator